VSAANAERRSLRATAPSDDIDEVVIDRAIRGIRVRMTEQELQFAINLLVESGHSVGEIARLLHAGQRTVASRMLA
jgi:DNA-binding NarL/FixJ family response regulator